MDRFFAVLVQWVAAIFRYVLGLFRPPSLGPDGPFPSLVDVPDVAPAPIVIDAAPSSSPTRPEPVHTASTPWSFYEGLVDMVGRHGWNAVPILMVMWSESNVSPWAGSSASGLIQFIPSVLAGLGWAGTPEEFRQLSAVQQLPYVERYYAGRLPPNNDPSVTYLINYEPAKVRFGANPHYVLDRAGEEFYEDNWRAFDPGREKGFIEVGDLGKRLARVCVGATWLEHRARLMWVERERGGGSVAAIASGVAGFAIFVAALAYWKYVQV